MKKVKVDLLFLKPGRERLIGNEGKAGPVAVVAFPEMVVGKKGNERNAAIGLDEGVGLSLVRAIAKIIGVADQVILHGVAADVAEKLVAVLTPMVKIGSK